MQSFLFPSFILLCSLERLTINSQGRLIRPFHVLYALHALYAPYAPYKVRLQAPFEITCAIYPSRDMRAAILFALLASVVVAVPATHKRECTRKHGHGHQHQVAQNGTAPVADSAVAEPMPSPSAIAAVALANGAGNANVDSNNNGRGGGRGKGGSSQAVRPASSTSRVGSPSASKALVGSPSASKAPVVVSSASKAPVVVPSASSSTSRSTSKAAPAPTFSAAPAPSPSAGAGNTARFNGAGLAINGQSVKSFSGFLKGNLGWYTGWADTPLSGTDGLEWVPQVWGASDVDGIKDAASKWPSSVKSVLSFNERESIV